MHVHVVSPPRGVPTHVAEKGLTVYAHFLASLPLFAHAIAATRRRADFRQMAKVVHISRSRTASRRSMRFMNQIVFVLLHDRLCTEWLNVRPYEVSKERVMNREGNVQAD